MWTFLQRPGAISLAAALALGACTGHISGRAGQGGVAGTSGGAGNGGAAGSSITSVTASLTCDGTRDVATVPLHRLTRQEYANSVRDLLGVALGSGDDLPADENVGPFAANSVTSLTDLGTEQYQDSAERLAQSAVANVDTLVSTFGGCDRTAMGDAACAAAFVERFGARTFRRPLTSDEKTRYVGLYTTFSSTGFADGVRVVVEAMLQSPSFLYHVEYGAAAPTVPALVALDPYQVAARLAFFLWTSVPDEALLSAAAAGGLGDAATVGAQVQRMLKDPRASDALASFHTQWLDLGKLPALTKDPTLFPSFTPALRDAMQAETTGFADYVLRQGDGRLETLLSAPYSILDGPLFDLYGVARPAGTTGPTLTQLNPKLRAGLLTQASFLASHAHENQTSPVARGVAVLRNVMCVAMPDPPANVNNAPPDPGPGATTRQRFAAHEMVASCAACHVSIDGIGMGFEAYDAMGASRTMDQGLPVDATGKVVGTDAAGPFDGAVALAQRLAASPDVRLCVARQWFRFALGRMETANDNCSLKGSVDAFDGSNHDVRALLGALATSDAFLYRREVP